jgi:hypothetical protein
MLRYTHYMYKDEINVIMRFMLIETFIMSVSVKDHGTYTYDDCPFNDAIRNYYNLHMLTTIIIYCNIFNNLKRQITNNINILKTLKSSM